MSDIDGVLSLATSLKALLPLALFIGALINEDSRPLALLVLGLGLLSLLVYGVWSVGVAMVNHWQISSVSILVTAGLVAVTVLLIRRRRRIEEARMLSNPAFGKLPRSLLMEPWWEPSRPSAASKAPLSPPKPQTEKPRGTQPPPTPVALAAAQPSVATPVVVATTAPAVDAAVAEKVLSIVAEQIGYPREILDLDLCYEADLAVDDLKWTDVFGRVREVFGLPREDNLDMQNYPTIRHLAVFVQTHKLSHSPDQG
jgi:hypothetical protein